MAYNSQVIAWKDCCTPNFVVNNGQKVVYGSCFKALGFRYNKQHFYLVIRKENPGVSYRSFSDKSETRSNLYANHFEP